MNFKQLQFRDYVSKLVGMDIEYAAFYLHQGQRTSNLVDRTIRRLEKFLRNRQYFHGHFVSAQHSFRTADLNQFVYSQDSWPNNILVATSRNEFRNTQQLRLTIKVF